MVWLKECLALLFFILLVGCTKNQIPFSLQKAEGLSSSSSAAVLPVGAPSSSLVDGLYNVKSFGAKGDGVTDDTAAIKSAAQALMADFRGFVTDGGSMVVSAKGLYFPYGNYRLSQPITFDVPVVRLQSDSGARIIQTGSQPIFLFSRVVSANISGMKFLYGTNQLSFSNNNINAVMLKIENCEFRESTDYAVKTIGVSGDLHLSTMLTITDSKFYDVAGVLDNYSDRAVIRDSWVQVSSLTLQPNTGVFLNRSGNLMLDNMTGIPSITTATPRVPGVHWVKMLGGELIASRSRFGGEGAGYPIVSFDWDGTTGSSSGSSSAYPYMGPSIIIENSWICAGGLQTPDAAVININKRFPHLIRVVGNSYLIDSPYVRLNNVEDAESYVNGFPAARGAPRTLFSVVLGPNMASPTKVSYPKWFNDLIREGLSQ